jgi:hypothetical protein
VNKEQEREFSTCSPVKQVLRIYVHILRIRMFGQIFYLYEYNLLFVLETKCMNIVRITGKSCPSLDASHFWKLWNSYQQNFVLEVCRKNVIGKFNLGPRWFHRIPIFMHTNLNIDPPLLSSGQRSGVRFAALPNFLRSSGSGTRSTQPRENNWGAT